MSSAKATEPKIGSLIAGVPTLTISLSTITNLYYNTMVNLGATDATLSSANITINDLGGGWFNIVGKVLQNGCWVSKNLAINLILIGSDFYPPVQNGGETHQCIGSNCSHCFFTYDSHGNTNGCGCSAMADDCGGPASCSHTATSGSGIDWLGWVGALLTGLGIWIH